MFSGLPPLVGAISSLYHLYVYEVGLWLQVPAVEVIVVPTLLKEGATLFTGIVTGAAVVVVVTVTVIILEYAAIPGPALL